MLAAIAVLLGACQTEEKVVSVKGGFGGLARLPGASSQLPLDAVGPSAADSTDRWSQLLGKDNKGKPVEGHALRRELDDGGVLLVARSPRELIVHLYETLRDNELELLEEQVISQRTKQAYMAERKTPKDAVAWLVEHREDVEALLATMPAGEQTPGVLMKPLGNNAFRLSSADAPSLGLKLRRLDLVIEQGRFRLLTIQ
ncbi:MAG: hypothetical protein ACKVZJ_04470 [Phycisphaerales bacterium]